MKALALLLLALACAPLPSAPLCSPAVLGVPCSARLTVTVWAEGFTPEQDAALRSGGAMWEAATGGAVLFDWRPDGRVRFLPGVALPGMLGATSATSARTAAALSLAHRIYSSIDFSTESCVGREKA